MKHSAQFIIEKGVLKNYNGRDSVVVVPDRVTSIGGWAFRGFQGLTSITLPEGVTSIGAGAFYSCKSLTSITLPEGLISIGESAFEYCDSLRSINIPEKTSVSEVRTFSGCAQLADQQGFVILRNILFDYVVSPEQAKTPAFTTLLSGFLV